MSKKPETIFQNKAVAYLKEKGIYCLNLYGDGRSGKGKPDVIACINGRFVAFELKVGANNLQDDQKIHKLWIKRSGGLHYTPRDIETFKRIVDDLIMEGSKCLKQLNR